MKKTSEKKTIKDKDALFISIIIGMLGVLSLVVGYFDNKLGTWGKLFQIIGALLTVGSLIDAYLSYKFYSNRKKSLDELSIAFDDIRKHIKTYTEQITLEELRKIESELSASSKTQCEIWILTNSLAVENSFLKEILNNIVKKNINYYYIIRDKDEEALKTLSKQIKRKVAKKHEKCKGALYFYCNNIIELLPSYSDVVIYIDETASILSEKRRGFFCFQNSKINGTYYYTEIKEDSIKEIVTRTFKLKSQFKKI